MGAAEAQEAAAASGPSIFGHIVVGIDGTEASLEACRQAARLAEVDAIIDAAAVVHIAPVSEGETSGHESDVLQLEAESAVAHAAPILGDRGRMCFLDGFVDAALIEHLRRSGATLLALGTHGHHRVTEILIGGVAGVLLHKAPCSVLIARPAEPIEAFPRSLVVGVDGSPQADRAVAVARQLATRFEVPLREIVATNDGVDFPSVQLRAPLVELVDERPVTALVEASKEAGLLIVGSRGLHGLRALGSVSERVAHRAACSVLVVR
jgi:nucleotide-binding universal stress UspA family protein